MYTNEDLSQDQLDTVAGGFRGGGLVGILLGEVVIAGAKWVAEKFEEYKDKRGDTFEHWG